MKIFGYDIFESYLILFGSSFKFPKPPVMLVAGLINFGVTNQVPQVSFKLVVGDLMLVSSYEFVDIIFCESLVISEAISDYEAQAFALHSLGDSLPIYLITCSSPHKTSKDGDILHSPGHLILTLGDDFTSHVFMLKDSIYHFLGCSSHVSNSQAILLSYQLISLALHGSSFHLATVYISDSVEHFLLLPKRKIHPHIMI